MPKVPAQPPQASPNPNPEKKTVQQWKEEIEGLLMGIRDHFLAVGEKLFFAKRQLEGHEWEQIQTAINKWAIRESDLAAAKAGFLYGHPELGNENDLRVHPDLLFAGAANSKVLRTRPQVQQRLLSEEKFAILNTITGEEDTPKCWSEMSEAQRNLLLTNGGQIRSLADQQKEISGAPSTPAQDKFFPLTAIQVINGEVILRGPNKTHLKASLSEFKLEQEKAGMLNPEEQE